MDPKATRERRVYFILLAIFLIALSLRLVTARYDLLLGGDPWYHYNLAKKTLESGSYPNWVYSIYYPTGTWTNSLIGLYYLPVIFYNLVSFTGVSFFRVFQILPALFGALICVVLYLLVRESYDEKIALISAFLFAISPAGIERSLAGFYRGDVFFVFFMLLTIWFYINSLGKLYFSPLAGVTLFLSGLVWGGWPFALVVLTLGTLLASLYSYLRGSNFSRLAARRWRMNIGRSQY